MFSFSSLGLCGCVMLYATLNICSLQCMQWNIVFLHNVCARVQVLRNRANVTVIYGKQTKSKKRKKCVSSPCDRSMASTRSNQSVHRTMWARKYAYGSLLCLIYSRNLCLSLSAENLYAWTFSLPTNNRLSVILGAYHFNIIPSPSLSSLACSSLSLSIFSVAWLPIPYLRSALLMHWNTFR